MIRLGNLAKRNQWQNDMTDASIIPKESPPYLTVAQAAKEIQVARKTVYEWIKQGWVTVGTLPGGTEYRIRRSDWSTFLETLFGKERQPAPKPPPLSSSPPTPALAPKGPRDFFALGAGLPDAPRRDP